VKLPRLADIGIRGSDVATSFPHGSPLMPMHARELSARMLAVDVQAWGEDAREVVDQVGELVVV
jgi:acetoacetyl-CoA synthetase